MMVIVMGTRSFLLVFAFLGCTAAAVAQTSSLDNVSPTFPATYTLVTSVDSGDLIVSTLPAIAWVPVAAPASSDETKPVAASEIDGGDGISDAPDAGWQVTTAKVRIN